MKARILFGAQDLNVVYVKMTVTLKFTRNPFKGIDEQLDTDTARGKRSDCDFFPLFDCINRPIKTNTTITLVLEGGTLSCQEKGPG